MNTKPWTVYAYLLPNVTACDSGATYIAVSSRRTPGLGWLTEVKGLTQHSEQWVAAPEPRFSPAGMHGREFTAAAEGCGSLGGADPPLLLTGVYTLPTRGVLGLVWGAAAPHTHFCFCLVISSVLGRQFVHGRDP